MPYRLSLLRRVSSALLPCIAGTTLLLVPAPLGAQRSGRPPLHGADAARRSAEPPFPGDAYALPDLPGGLVVVDLDGDGIDDAVVSSVASGPALFGTVSVLLGSASGRLTAPVSFATGGQRPTSIAHGDFEGDGDADFVIAHDGTSTLNPFLNDGTGAFTAALPTVVSSSPSDVAVGDLDGDGFDDLVAGTGNGGRIAVVLSRGDGTFEQEVTYQGGSWPDDIALGDFDADGDLDVVADLTSDRIQFFWNLGDGTFQWGGPFLAGLQWLSVADAADLDGDGAPEILLTTLVDDGLHVLPNDGAGGFLPPVTYLETEGVRAVETGDWNGDGHVDVAAHVRSRIGRPGELVRVLRNRGDGVLEYRQAMNVDDLRGLASGDVDGDGDPDVVAVDEDGLYVLRNRARRTFDSRGRTVVYARPVAIELDDLTGDGLVDALMADRSGSELHVARNLGGGELSATEVWSAPLVDSPRTGDLDRDGDLDVATITSNTDLTVFWNRGDGTFVPSTIYSAPFRLWGIAVADLDADGWPDLAVSRSAGAYLMSIFLNDGAGGFPSQSSAYAINSFPHTVRAADLEGDGDVDLVVTGHGAGPEVRVLVNAGDGTFAPAPTVPVAPPSVVSRDLLVGDLDGDLLPDLVMILSDGSAATIFNRGGATFAVGALLSVGNARGALADVDGDGDLDLVGGDLDTDVVSLSTNTGAGAFATTRYFECGERIRDVACADLDGDGAPDVAAVADFELTYLFNQTLRPSRITDVPPTSPR